MKTQSTFILILILIAPLVNVAQPGSTDMTFSDNAGIQYVDFLVDNEEWMNHSVVDDQDRIWMAGSTPPDGDGEILLVRLTADGEYDPTFSDDGQMIINIADDNTEEVHGITMQGDMVIVAGRTVADDNAEPFVLRCTVDGDLDQEFGTMGIVKVPMHAAVADVAVDNADNIYLTGMTGGNIFVAKLLTDGDFDSNFGFIGLALADFPSTDEAAAMSVDEDGNIFVFGNGLLNDVLRGHITSFLPNGATNTNFTDNGRKSFTWPNNKAFSVGHGFLSADATRFYLAGSIFDGVQIDGAIIAVDYDSNLIESFGDNGFWEMNITMDGTDIISQIIESPDGLYAALLVEELPDVKNTVVAHMDANGVLLEGFGENNSGWATYNIAESAYDQPTGLGFQSDGRLIVTGVANINPDLGLAGYAFRLNTQADETFIAEFSREKLSIWPNPGNGTFWLDAQSSSLQGQPYSIFNGAGQQIQSGSIFTDLQHFDISQFPAGVYHLVIDNLKATRIIKNK